MVEEVWQRETEMQKEEQLAPEGFSSVLHWYCIRLTGAESPQSLVRPVKIFQKPSINDAGPH